jgi:hypothetical protein
MATSPRSKRTAVLAVHGMGIQRPLDTARGLVNAVWLEEDDRPTAEGDSGPIPSRATMTSTSLSLPRIHCRIRIGHSISTNSIGPIS